MALSPVSASISYSMSKTQSVSMEASAMSVTTSTKKSEGPSHGDSISISAGVETTEAIRVDHPNGPAKAPAAVPEIAVLSQEQLEKGVRQFAVGLRQELTKVLLLFGHGAGEADSMARKIAGPFSDAVDRAVPPPQGTGQNAVSTSSQMSVVARDINITIHQSKGGTDTDISVHFTSLQFVASQTTNVALGKVLISEKQAETLSRDPLVVNLDGKGIRLTSAEQGVYFDVDADGTKEKTAWVGKGNAFLALDRNNNGKIDDGGELFGDQHGANNGFAELAKFDDNHDGEINEDDKVYKSLLLVHGDGTTSSLADEGIQRIRLDAVVRLPSIKVQGGTVEAVSAYEGKNSGDVGYVRLNKIV